MEKYDINFKKKYGQNFLKDLSIVKRIVDVSGIDNKSLVVEVGPGGGIMTRELDEDLKKELCKKIGEFTNVEIVFQDFLTSNLVDKISTYTYDSLFFVSNVPYYITTPIIFKLIKSGLNFNKIVMMVQKEVGDRFTTSPGSKEYGSITVLLNYFYNIKKEFYVSRKKFVPEPNVDSVIVSFTGISRGKALKDFTFFEKLVRDSFQFKRKTVRNNLKGYDLSKVEQVLRKYDYDLNVRAEMLSVDIFVELANFLLG